MSSGPDDQEPQSTEPQRRASDHGERRQHERKTHHMDATPRYLDPGDTVFSLWGRVIMARYRRIAAAATRHIIQRPLHIGVSARIFHPNRAPPACAARTCNTGRIDRPVGDVARRAGVHDPDRQYRRPAASLQHPPARLRQAPDGLVLQGGADVSPQTYSETPTRPEWGGDRARDMYELELLHEFVEAGKPVLGICRGCQLINVAFGGTLYQDIATEMPESLAHVNDDYDRNRHEVSFPPGSSLARLFKGRANGRSTIHHQAVKTLGRDMAVEALSVPDNMVEAIRYRKAPFVMGLQWHPEFHRAGGVGCWTAIPSSTTSCAWRGRHASKHQNDAIRKCILILCHPRV
jgi:gamma-glutamyl-gamma-aminobutyrate hydrolase PuuD